MMLLLVLALQTAGDAPPVAAPGPNAPAAISHAAPPGSDTVVCRSDAHTGTHIGSRTCHTEREWRELEFQSAEWMRKMRPQPCLSGSSACPGSP